MEPKTCLYSALRPGQPKATRTRRGFLALSGELRNQIYHYYFDSEVRCEIVAKGCTLGGKINRVQDRNRSVKLWHAQLHTDDKPYKYVSKPEAIRTQIIRASRRLGKHSFIQGLRTDWSTSVFALALVCKQVHAETQSLLYDNTRSVLNAPKRISSFLSALTRPQLQLITKLELHYTSYGNPRLACDVVWQERHRASWTRVCKDLAKNVKNLRELDCFISVHEMPLHFTLREAWLQPVLQFRRLTVSQKSYSGSKDCDTAIIDGSTALAVKIDLLTPLSHPVHGGHPGLKKASKHLHQLFARAITLAILGATEQQAMKDFEEAWSGQYRQWQHYLGLAATGW